MYKASAFVFWTVLILYLITLFTASYVGVYLTYVALPVIVVAGLFMKFSKPRSSTPGAFENAMKAVSDGLYVFGTVIEKAAAEAEKAATELRAKAEAERDAEEARQTSLLNDRFKALREAKMARLNLSLELHKGTITRDVWQTETTKLDQKIAALEKSQPPLPVGR